MARPVSPKRKAIKLRLSLVQQAAATNKILDRLGLQQTFDITLKGITEEISLAVKFPFVSIELFQENNRIAGGSHGEQPPEPGTQIRLDLTEQPYNGVLCLAHSEIVELDNGLTQWIHNIATILGIFCERFFLKQRVESELETTQRNISVVKEEANQEIRQLVEKNAMELQQLQEKIALERSHEIERERKAWQQQTVAYQRLAERASQRKDPASYYLEVHQLLKEYINANDFFVALYEGEKIIFPYSSRGEESDLTDRYKPFVDSVTAAGEPFIASPDQNSEWLGVPLKVAGMIRGVIGIHDRDSNYGMKEKQILQFASLQIAGVLEKQDALRLQAVWDELTSLPNSSFFPFLLKQRLAHAKRTREMVSVLLLEIDGFGELKQSIRDALIKQIAERMLHEMKEGDVIVHRGEGRFLCCISNLRNGEDIAGVAQKILTRLAGPFIDNGKQYSFSGSIGVSLYPSDGTDAKTLVRAAEAALAPAKRVKGNSYRFFAEGMNVKVGARLIFRKQLQQAVVKREFVLHFQPILGIDKGEIQGVEALVRWEKGGRVIYPGEFLEALDEMGLAAHLDDWVIRAACNERALWQKEGFGPIYMSLNLSSQLFWQTGAEKISAILKATGVSPASLMLEISEKTLMNDMEKATEILTRLHDFGVRLSIDDFGVGSASVSYLKRYPIDALKIDSSLVRGVSSDPNTAAVVATIISLAHRLRIHVIAEGIESQPEFQALQSLGCNSYQGRFQCPPLPGELFKEFWRKHLLKQKTVEHKVTETQPLPAMPSMPVTSVPAVPAIAGSPKPVAVVNPIRKPASQSRPVTAQYLVSCFSCQSRYDAMEASWCRCLSSEQTLVCPNCKKCFCKASLEYRHQVWDSGPESFWERKRRYESDQNGLPENLPRSQVKAPLVLVVDDERAVLKMACRLIREMGYSVILAHNGLEGLEIAKSYHPQLVLSDALLPKMDGREMCRLLKLDPETADIRAVIMTAFTGAAKYKSTALKEYSFDDQLQKPVEFEKLRSVLKKFL